MSVTSLGTGIAETKYGSTFSSFKFGLVFQSDTSFCWNERGIKLKRLLMKMCKRFKPRRPSYQQRNWQDLVGQRRQDFATVLCVFSWKWIWHKLNQPFFDFKELINFDDMRFKVFRKFKQNFPKKKCRMLTIFETDDKRKNCCRTIWLPNQSF